MSPALRSFNLAPTPDTTGRAEDWRDSALCIGVDPELMYLPGDNWASHPKQATEAKAVCATCPVKDACLQWALDTGDAYSIAGGTTPDERAVLLGVDDACGTYPKGYNRHRRAGEKACESCKFAYRSYSRARRESRKSAARASALQASPEVAS